jgi:two-component system OmpR family sensor kinase
MDGRRPRRPRSLKIQLSLWIAAAILAAGCAATAASFYFAFGEAHTFQDDTLRQIGILIGKIPDASIEQAGITQDADPSTEAVAIMRMKDDDTGTCNLSGDIAIPCELSNGWHTIDAGKQRWRLLVTSRPSGLRFAIIQSTALRDEIARDGSLRTLIPMLCLMLALIPLVTLLIQRMLSPVTRLAATLDQARDDDFGEMPETGVPAEIIPFVMSINRLLRRLIAAMSQQRRFVADAAHELRSPLTALTLQAQNLDRAAMNPDLRERVDALRAGLARSTRLVTQLLSLARLQQSDPAALELVSLQDVVKQVMEESHAYAQSRHTDLGVERLESIAVKVERLALHTALRNLVDNAIRYTPERGRVDIRVYPENHWVVIEVQDNGPGISEEDLERVCQPFFRGSETGETGSGLGLAIVSDIARNMGGSLGLSTTASGLLVRLKIPACRTPPTPIG